MSISLENQLSAAIEATLAPFLDEDICEYIQSTLAENPHDEDARENVRELLRGSIDDDVDGCATEQILQDFFEKLNISHGGDGKNRNDLPADVAEDGPLRRLTNTITMKANDIQSFASGLSAESRTGGDHEDEAISSIQSFYANMIDISGNDAAMSEKRRRKERQKALREEMEEAERKRAIQEAMDILNEEEEKDDGGGEDGGGKVSDDFLDAAADNSADVHLKNFDLPNLRGGGTDLLQNASLTLARGRRYGLMGRNGCGKTTLLTFIAQRSIEGAVPKKMTMLLVRQEIIGNDLSPVETVLKSDAKREGVKRFIKYCEDELERLDGGASDQKRLDGNGDDVNISDSNSEKEQQAVKGSSKSRQKLAERRKARLAMTARDKTKNDGTASKLKKENIEIKRSKLSEKLGKAYMKLAELEEADGGDPEYRARKVLSGMGFSDEMQNKPTSQLSGGWRMRVSISCALFANPSLLL
jgi:ABC-type dipeptide/oligopeptide/nickel transport system ATPase subunit